MMELHRDRFGSMVYNSDLGSLELHWSPETASMTDDDFKAALDRYADLAGQQSASSLLVDVTQFRHSPSEEVGAWRDKHVIPRYNAAGVQKFAYIVPAGAPGTVSSGATPKQGPGEDYLTAHFESRDDARTWFES